MLRRKLEVYLWAVMFAVLLTLPRVAAQTTFGSISGTVTDPSGSPVPGAQVTLTNLATSESRISATNNDGLYTFPNLAPGQYKIDVEKTGFKHVTRDLIAVEVQSAVSINITLEVGQVSETIEVTAQTPLLQPETSSLGQVVDQRESNELPLNGRNIFNLVEISPSVVPQGSSGGTPVGKNPFDWGNYQIGGSFGNQSAEYLDGQPLNIGYINLPVLIPIQDSIQEFKVQTNNLGPEWGKFSGGIINLDTKSGSNQFHGALWEFLRNKVLNANDFFNNANGVKRPPWTQNQFGGDVGGPILPNRTFFFFSYEGYRQRTAQPFLLTVPTAAMRAGNFNGIAAIYDPFSTVVSGGTVTRTPFPNNTIPITRFDPTARALINLWPNPTNPATAVNNYATSTPTGGNTNQTLGRLDQVITNSQRLFFRYAYYNLLDLPIDPLGTGLCQDRCTEKYSTHAVVLGYTWTITPNLILDVPVGITRFAYNRRPKNAGIDFTSINWPASFNAEVPTSLHTPPTPCVVGEADSVMCSQGQSFIQDRNTQPNVSPSMTWVKGRHTFKFGGQYEVGLDNYTQTNIASGAFAFNSAFTSSNGQAGGTIGGLQNGFAFASFLLGTPLDPGNVVNHFFGAATVPNFTAGKQFYWALYFGDTWKLTDKLTLNLGFRYEFQSPWTERFNRMSIFNPNAPSAIASNVKGEIFLVDSPESPSRYNYKADYTNGSPRIGLAYSATPKTVIRAGYGIFWIPNDVSFALNPLNDEVNSINTNINASVNGAGLIPNRTLNNPWNQFVVPPGRSPSFQQILEGVSLTGVSDYSNHPSGYVQQWNFDIQREAPAGFFVDAAYAGSKGTHLPQYTQQIDQLPDQYLSMGSALLATVPNPFYGKEPNAGSALSGPTTTVGQLLRPFPQYTGVQLAGQGSFDSIYHALQLTVTRRFRGGGTLLAAYTWSKLISDTDTLTTWLESPTGGVGSIQDWNNLRGERSLSSQDIPQRLVISYVLDLPFGKGRKFASNAGGVRGALISGWGVDGVTTFQNGFPLKLMAQSNTIANSFGGGNVQIRPNVTCAGQGLPGSAEKRLGEWFNIGCFAQPADFTFGDEPRVDPRLRAQGLANFDFAAFKRTNFGPEAKFGIEFRAEFFNIFNKPQFAAPNTTLGSSQFGQVTSTLTNGNPRLVQFALRFGF